MIKTAIFATDRLFGDSLTALFNGRRYDVVVNETDACFAARKAKDNDARIFIVDSLGLDDQDLQFLLGAATFGEFALIVLVSNNSDELLESLRGYNVNAYKRSEGGEGLLELADNLIGLATPVTRGRGRPRMTTHGFELSAREYEVALLISKGFTNNDIVTQMGVKVQSVKNMVSTVIRKLHCENRVQVALRINRQALPGPAPAQAQP